MSLEAAILLVWLALCLGAIAIIKLAGWLGRLVLRWIDKAL